jgi:hypothetical protein
MPNKCTNVINNRYNRRQREEKRFVVSEPRKNRLEINELTHKFFTFVSPGESFVVSPRHFCVPRCLGPGKESENRFLRARLESLKSVFDAPGPCHGRVWKSN